MKGHSSFLTLLLVCQSLAVSRGDLADGWEIPITGSTSGSLALGPDGTIYRAGSVGLQALDPSGELLWTYSIGFGAASSPVIGHDQTIYLGGADKQLHAVNPNGTEKWRFPASDWIGSTPALLGHDALCFGANDGNFYILDLDGGLRNLVPTGGPIYSSPAIGADLSIYFGSADGVFRALNPDGSLQWQQVIGSEIHSSPAIGPDGSVYVGGNDAKLYAFGRRGTRKWAFDIVNSAERQSPSVAADGTIYFPGRDGVLFAVTPAGTLKWKFEGENYSWSQGVTILSDGGVCGTIGGRFQMVDVEGNPGDGFPAAPSIGAPAVSPEGAIYLGVDSFLLKFTGSSPMAAEGWPTFHRDARRSGAIPLEPAISMAWPTDGMNFRAGDHLPMRAEVLNWPAADISVTFVASQTVIGASMAPPFAFLWTNLLSGEYSVAAIAVDGSGASLTSAPVRVTVSSSTANAPPVVSLLLPPDGATLLSGEPLLIQADAHDPDGLVTHVDFFDSGSLLGRADFPDFVLMLPQPAAKTYLFQAAAVDNAASASTTTVTRVTVLDKAWKYLASDYATSASFAPDGTVYFGADRALVALHPNGSTNWVYAPGISTTTLPAVSPDGQIYVALNDHSLVALDPGGDFQWRYQAEGLIRSSPAIAADGTLYLGSGDGKLHALSPEGANLWTFPVDSGIHTSPALGNNGTIYFTASVGLHALSATGGFKWAYPVEGVAGSPAIGADGTIYIGTSAGELHAVTPAGEKLWSFIAEAGFNLSSPIIGSDETIYAGAGSIMYAIRRNGSLKWSFRADSEISSPPLLAADGTLYFACFERHFIALDSTGQIDWRLDTPLRLTGQPALSSNGLLCLPLGDALLAIQTGTSPDQGPWPMFQQNPQRHGLAFSIPQLLSVTPGAQTNFVAGEPVALSLETTSPNGQIARVEFYANDTLIGTVSDAPFTFTWLNAPPGINHVYARAVDEIGAHAATIPIRVDVVPPETAPEILSHPAAQFLDNGATVTLEADFFGTRPVSFQWYKDGAPLPNGTNLTLILPDASLADSAAYSLVISNSWGAASSQTALISILQPYHIKWSAPMLNGRGSLAIAQGSRIIIPGQNGIHARGPRGQFLWSYPAPGPVWTTPALGIDGSVYFGVRSFEFHAITSGGEANWVLPPYTGGLIPPALATNGVIYSLSGQTLYALSPEGGTNWSLATPNPVTVPPVVGRDGTIYLCTDAIFLPSSTNYSAFLMAVHPDGQEKWRLEFTQPFTTSPVIAEDGSILVGVRDQELQSVSPEGDPLWSFSADGPLFGAAVIAEDGTIYVGGEGPQQGAWMSGRFYALTPDGRFRWVFPTVRTVSQSAAVARDGTVYFGAQDGGFYALNPNGTLKWRIPHNVSVESSPAIGFDGTIYFSTQDEIRAVEGSSPLARGAWPMFRHDVRRTANASTSLQDESFYYPFASNAFDDAVSAVARQGAHLYVGGYFQIGGGVPASHIVQWDGQHWLPLGLGTDAEVLSLALDAGNLYVGGVFTHAGGIPASYIARWDGTDWHPLGTGMNDRVYALEVHQGALYAGGGFSSAGGNFAGSVARWDGAAWEPVGAGFRSSVFDLLSWGPDLYASGFGNLGPSPSPVTSVTKWDGNQWSNLGQIFGDARTLAVFDGQLYVGGNYLQENLKPLGSLARWDGVEWHLVAETDFFGINTLRVGNGFLYAGGAFTNIAGVPANGIARFDGTNWFALGPGVSGAVPRFFPHIAAIDLHDGELFAGGAFNLAGHRRIYHFARWDDQQWSSYGPLLRFLDGKFQFTVSDALGATYGIETSDDLIHWTRVATYQNEANATQFIDQSASTNAHRFYRVVSP